MGAGGACRAFTGCSTATNGTLGEDGTVSSGTVGTTWHRRAARIGLQQWVRKIKSWRLHGRQRQRRLRRGLRLHSCRAPRWTGGLARGSPAVERLAAREGDRAEGGGRPWAVGGKLRCWRWRKTGGVASAAGGRVGDPWPSAAFAWARLRVLASSRGGGRWQRGGCSRGRSSHARRRTIEGGRRLRWRETVWDLVAGNVAGVGGGRAADWGLGVGCSWRLGLASTGGAGEDPLGGRLEWPSGVAGRSMVAGDGEERRRGGFRMECGFVRWQVGLVLGKKK